MKFLKWLFNFGSRHAGEIRRYEKGKLSTKICAIVLMAVLVGVTLTAEYFSIKLYADNAIVGILLAVVAVVLLLSTLETGGLYSYLGLKMFTVGTVVRAVKDGEDKQENQGEGGKKASSDGQDNENTPELGSKSRSHHGIDLVVGILGLVFATGVVVGAVLLLFV